MRERIVFKFFGARLIKTGIAVFLTAKICYLFNLPVAFAVIIAIATIEPTASDSIRKGMIRFPAALIGAGLAMTFTYWFGQTPLTFTLAAVLTIYVCIKCKLEAGALIATITAVAMIPITYDHYFLTFVERVGTTTIGLIISTLVNLFILPAKFSTEIKERNDRLYKETANLLKKRIDELINEKKSVSKECQKEYQRITSELSRSFQLCRFQREEWKYHRHTWRELRTFIYETKKLDGLQQIHYHLGHIISVHINGNMFTNSDKDLLRQSVHSTVQFLESSGAKLSSEHVEKIRELDQQFWHTNEGNHPAAKKYHHHFAPETIILFVILSIHDVLEEIERLSRHKI
ncbi:FUSC family protein [Halalkalibacter okhensis]|uniref:Integral membrane protein n=1 Tax=Halalkalibacter okhensis TaxID=333138 RepID=A0A0B0IC61_9BACI|nr:aromatic acid exporter family protein [Halalkalibacter okhensis]KHF38850.1 hypothetical protein LQ50_18660 [Halalkalibacter okhensis]